MQAHTPSNDTITVNLVLDKNWLLSGIDGKGKAVALMTAKANGISTPALGSGRGDEINTKTMFKCPVCEQSGIVSMLTIKNLCTHLNDHYNQLHEHEQVMNHPLNNVIADRVIPSRVFTNGTPINGTPIGAEMKAVNNEYLDVNAANTTNVGNVVNTDDKRPVYDTYYRPTTVENYKRVMINAEKAAYFESEQLSLGMTEEQALEKALRESISESAVDEEIEKLKAITSVDTTEVREIPTQLNTSSTTSTTSTVSTVNITTPNSGETNSTITTVRRATTMPPNMLIRHVTADRKTHSCYASNNSFEAD